MKVIGVTGRDGSGRDELVRYLNDRYGVSSISVGDIVREIADSENVESTRENLDDILKKYMEKFGDDYFINKVLEEIKSNRRGHVAVSGIRTPKDVSVLRNGLDGDFVLVGVVVGNPSTRYERVRNRGEERDRIEYKEFLRRDLEEDTIFGLRETIREADIEIDNSGSLDEFHCAIDERVAKSFLGTKDKEKRIKH
jgi:dephospho-CoA kinase